MESGIYILIISYYTKSYEFFVTFESLLNRIKELKEIHNYDSAFNIKVFYGLELTDLLLTKKNREKLRSFYDERF